MKVLFNQPAETNKARIRYVLDFLEAHPLANGKLSFTNKDQKDTDLTIDYGIRRSGQYFIPAQQLFFGKEVIKNKDLRSGDYFFQDLKLYAVGQKAERGRPFLTANEFAFDIIETIFYHISRYEEFYADPTSLNQHGMMENKDLFLPQHGLEKIPVVDQLVYVFFQSIDLDCEARKTDYVLSHDIDKIYKYNSTYEGIKSILWPLIFKADLKWSWRNFLAFYQSGSGAKKDPYDSYDFLFSRSDCWKTKEVYFMAGGSTRFDLYDKNYLRSCPEILDLARKSGYKIGIHPSYNTVDDKLLMSEEKQNLEQTSGQIIEYTRQHFLRYFPGKTDFHIQNNGFRIDSTLGYNRFIGFRCGTGFAYKLYDFKNESAFSFLEQPLIVMDSALIHESRDNAAKFKRILFDFILANRKYTQISFNFHNSTFDPTISGRNKLKHIYNELEKTLEEI